MKLKKLRQYLADRAERNERALEERLKGVKHPEPPMPEIPDAVRNWRPGCYRTGLMVPHRAGIEDIGYEMVQASDLVVTERGLVLKDRLGHPGRSDFSLMMVADALPDPRPWISDYPNVSRGVRSIQVERIRQIASKGFTPKHDSQHDPRELIRAAMAYLLYADGSPDAMDGIVGTWPWDPKEFKPTEASRERNLEKAGALVAAAIDRLQ